MKLSKILIFLLFTIVFILLFNVFSENTQSFLEWLKAKPVLEGAFIFIVVYAIVTVLLLPAFILNVGAGYIYGISLGTVVGLIGAVFGACVAFLIGRNIFRKQVQRFMSQYKAFDGLDKVITSNSLKFCWLLRISPISPFNLLNYFFAITNVNFWDYTWASALGLIPPTIFYTYVGTAAKNISDIVNQNPTTGNNTIIYIGLIFTIFTVILTTYISVTTINKALSEVQTKKFEQQTSNISLV